MKRLVLPLLLCAACDQVSGVDLHARWTQMGVDTLEVTTAVAGGTPASQLLGDGKPMASPYRILVESPAARPVMVLVTARQGDTPLASGALEVTPKTGQIVEVTLDLLESP